MALAQAAAMSVEEAAARGAARAKEGYLVPLIAEELIDFVDRDEWRTLAVRGLGGFIHDRRYADRQYAAELPHETDGVEKDRASDENTGPIRHLLPQPSHPARDFWMLALSQTYRIGDAMKSVLEFTLGDARLAADNYRARAYGNFKKADAFALAAKLLGEHKADTVRLLPKSAQQSIAEALR